MAEAKIYVTNQGLTLLNERLKKANEELAAVRTEKSVAYTASGDTWHDNPHFNRLEQEEKRKAERVSELVTLIGSAQVFSIDTRNTSRVQVGSIVHFCRYYKTSKQQEESVWEITGYGETDVTKKLIAYNAPMIRVLMGLSVGDTVQADSPKGRIEYEVLALFSTWEEVPEKFKPG